MFGVASSRIQANRIVDHLANAGFDRAGVSILFPDGKGEGPLAVEPDSSSELRHDTTLQIGLAVGGALGWLAGLDVFSAPGLGHYVAGGPLGAALTGATAGPVAAKGIKHALVSLGIRHHDARFYQNRLREGQILICLQAGEWREADAARKIFQALGAANITISGSKAARMLTRAFSRASGPRRRAQLTPQFGI